MATTANINRAEILPAGTVLKLYSRPTPPPHELSRRTGDPGTWADKLTLQAEYTVESDGKIKLGGVTPLVSGQPYLGWAEVGGKDVYLKVRSAEAAHEPSG